MSIFYLGIRGRNADILAYPLCQSLKIDKVGKPVVKLEANLVINHNKA